MYRLLHLMRLLMLQYRRRRRYSVIRRHVTSRRVM